MNFQFIKLKKIGRNCYNAIYWHNLHKILYFEDVYTLICLCVFFRIKSSYLKCAVYVLQRFINFSVLWKEEFVKKIDQKCLYILKNNWLFCFCFCCCCWYLYKLFYISSLACFKTDKGQTDILELTD